MNVVNTQNLTIGKSQSVSFVRRLQAVLSSVLSHVAH